MLRSLKSFGKLIAEIPFDLYRCLGLLSPDGWTGRTIRRHPKVKEALETIFSFRTSNQDNFERLCFTNNDAYFDRVIETEHGVCAGITTMNWLANYLAIFDENAKFFQKFHPDFRLPKGHTAESFGKLIEKKAREARRKFPSGTPEIAKLDGEDRMILDFYVPFIDRLFRDRKPTAFPYFSTLDSFSRHPALQPYLLKLSIETWYDVNVSLSSIFEVLVFGGRANVLNARQVQRLDEQVQAYLKNRIQPIVFVHLPHVGGKTKSIHILRITEARWEENSDRYVLEAVDPNFHKGEDIHRIVMNKVRSHPQAVQAIYEPYEYMQRQGHQTVSLSDVEIAPFFDMLSSHTMRSWKNWFRDEGNAILNLIEKVD